MIHNLADVKSTKIGINTYIWQYAVVLENAVIGSNCNINCHTFIENDVIIGNNVTIKSGVFLWDGIKIEDNVFVGPNVTFTNDKFPRSKQYPNEFLKTVINRNATIGAGSIILGGINIGEYSLIAAGAIVTKDIPARALVVGNPARIVGWVNEDGTKMNQFKNDIFIDNLGREWVNMSNELKLV